MRYLQVFALVVLAVALYSNPPKIKTYAEKKQIAEEMKKIAKALGVKCHYCHTEAERGLAAGDFTLLTKKGQFAHENMFPLTEKFKTNCSYCHSGYEKLTVLGERAASDAEFMKQYNKKAVKKITCESCHLAPQQTTDKPFAQLTESARQLRQGS